MRKKINLAIFALVASFSFATSASAATSIYYSVGQNTTDHKTGSPTVTIDGSGNATFSVAQTATNMGVGDVVTYGGATAFITAKTSTAVWSLRTATGGLPSATTTAPVTSIAHAFASLRSAVGGMAGSATSTNFLNTSDLVSGNYQLNIPLYYDSGPDTTTVVIPLFTTDSTHYIRLYTPTSTVSEVNQSQRHGGRWTSAAWSLDSSFSFTAAMWINTPYVRLDGLQVRNTTPSGTAYGVKFAITGGTDSLYVSNSIFSTSNDKWSCVDIGNGGSSYEFRIWNNVFMNCRTGLVTPSTLLTSYLYNNTFYDALTGVQLTTFGSYGVKAINNLFASTTNPFTSTGRAAAGSDYNSTDAASLGYIVSGTGNTHDATSTSPAFVGTTALDYHLATGDTVGRDTGVDLSADANLAVTNDIDGNARPFNSAFDRGADEYDGTTGDVTPPIVSGGSPSGTLATTTTSTTIYVSTDENATCKYDTAAGTAYGSMANVFTNTGTTTSGTVVSGLSSGHSYTYYVRCQDSVGNANTSDYTISFSVATNGVSYSPTCELADVNAAIGAAIAGDIVSVPAGTCTWGTGGAHLDINKAVTVKGAGSGSTIINIATSSGSYTAAAIRITAPATIKGFSIYTATSSTYTNTGFSASSDGFRITDIQYVDQQTNSGYFLYASSYGLVDNVDVTGGNGQNELIFARGPSDSWQTPNSMGSSTALFIEDSTFRGQGYVTDCNSNTRCVVRNNTITGSMKVDSHGFASNTPARGVRQTEIYNNVWTPTGASWTAIEMRGGTGMVFNNVSNVPSGTSGGWFYLRDYGYSGGPWSNFGTTISSIAIGTPTTITTSSSHGFFDQQPVRVVLTTPTTTINATYTATVTGTNTITIPSPVSSFWTSGYVSDYQTPYDYPLIDQIGVGMDPKVAGSEPFYVWNNLKGGATWSMSVPSIPSDGVLTYRAQTGSSTISFTEKDVIQANREYFAESGFDTSTTTVGVTTGYFSAIPATCTQGVGYWATDKGGNWDIENATTSDGALYKCVSTNTWAKSYIPYAFPHYLTAASTTGYDFVDRGEGARFFGSGKFYGVSTSTASGTYADLSIAPSSTSADTWLDVSISTWSTSGSRQKTWTESSENATTTVHTVGDLAANTAYDVKVDNVLGTGISGGSCTGGVCTSDSSGKITFTYSGGYSTHTFDVSLSTPDTTPPVISAVASSTAATTATITWTTDESATSTVEYGATASYGSASTSASFVTSHSIALSGLSAGATYHFRVSSGDSSYNYATSSDYTFTTSATVSAPTVSTSAPTSVGTSTLTFAGNLTSTGGGTVTDGGLTWGTVSNLSGGDTATSSFGSLLATGPFSAGYVGLTPGTTYYVRAYAANSAGTSTGSILSTTTLSISAPSVTTSAASSVSATGAILNGVIVNDGRLPSDASGFAWGTASDVSGGDTATTTGGLAHTLSSLSCNTAYYFRAYSTNTGGTGYGSIQTFTTSACSAPAPIPSSSSSSFSRRSRESRDVTVSGMAGEPVIVQSSATSTTSVATSSEPLSTSTPAATPSVSISASVPPTFSAFIELLISVGVIPPDKADIARAAISAVSAAPAFNRDMKRGDSGSDVLSLQKILSDKGYLTATPNGVFGPATFAALKAYQRANGIPSTGYFGPLTRASVR